MKFKLSKLFTILVIATICCGCKMSKNIPYFKELESSNEEIPVIQNESRIHNDDMLSITVTAMDPITVAPFNLPVVSYASPGSESIYTTPTMQPYIVDVNGNITFPILGQIKVGGLKKSEAAALIKEKLKPYLKDPIVIIQFMNYKITILGEVNRPGTYNIKNERVSILEALGLAGDLSIYGRRDNVLLIREFEGGKKEYVRINLNNQDILSSPFYFLQQNDVIYVEPNKTRVTNAASSTVTTYLTPILSTISTLATITTTIVAILNMNK